LEEFLFTFIAALRSRNISYCVLRNYEGLPYNNLGNDIDFLIEEESLDEILQLLFSIPDIQMTGYVKRAYVASIFLHGICWGDGLSALQVDFFFRLEWKGQSFVSVKKVLTSSGEMPEMPLLLIPNAACEAFVSLHHSFLFGGFIKEKYRAKISETCRNAKKAMLELHCNAFGQEIGEKLVYLLANEKFDAAIKVVGAARKAVLFRNLKKGGFQSIISLIRHYFYEVYIRFTLAYLDTIAIIGSDGSGKSSVLSHLTKKLKNTTKLIQVLHLKPLLFLRNRVQTREPVVDPHAKPARSAFVSTLKLLSWLIEYWVFFLFASKLNLTLRIFDRYYHDILVDPKRYRYGGPMWLARWVGKMIPKPDLFILLDAPPEVLQARKQEVPFEESARQRQAYLNLVRGMKNGIIVDASRPLDEVVAEVNKVILDFMAERTRMRLGR